MALLKSARNLKNETKVKVMNHKHNFDFIVADCIEDIRIALVDGHGHIAATGERNTRETRLFDLGLVKFDIKKAPSFEELFNAIDLYMAIGVGTKKGLPILQQIACNLEIPGVYEFVRFVITKAESIKKYNRDGRIKNVEFNFVLYNECLNKYLRYLYDKN